jgi:hypothetical protein
MRALSVAAPTTGRISCHACRIRCKPAAFAPGNRCTLSRVDYGQGGSPCHVEIAHAHHNPSYSRGGDCRNRSPRTARQAERTRRPCTSAARRPGSAPSPGPAHSGSGSAYRSAARRSSSAHRGARGSCTTHRRAARCRAAHRCAPRNRAARSPASAPRSAAAVCPALRWRPRHGAACADPANLCGSGAARAANHRPQRRRPGRSKTRPARPAQQSGAPVPGRRCSGGRGGGGRCGSNRVRSHRTQRSPTTKCDPADASQPDPSNGRERPSHVGRRAA